MSNLCRWDRIISPTENSIFSPFPSDASLQPYLDQINQIEEQVTALEQAAYKLDTYSKKLGKHFVFIRIKQKFCTDFMPILSRKYLPHIQASALWNT